MKAIMDNEGIAPRILKLHARWRKEASFTSWSFYPVERIIGACCNGRLVGLIFGVDASETRISLAPAGNRTTNPRSFGYNKRSSEGHE
jgi:hypothetical protein